MLRPLKGANFDRLLRSYDKHWRGQHDPWLTILLNEESRHLTYGPCFAIAWRFALGGLKNLEDSGLTVVHGHCDAIDAQAQTLTVNEASYAFDHLVLCNGRELSKWLPRLRLSTKEAARAGTFAVTQPLTTLVSQAGLHVGPRSEQEVVVGATRWETEPASPASSVLPECTWERMRGSPSKAPTGLGLARCSGHLSG